jgi:methyl-accepting chemotaxis protein
LRLSISSKLLANVAVALVLMLVLGVFALRELASLEHHANTLANQSLPTDQLLGTLQLGIADYAKGIGDYSLAQASTPYNSPAQKKALAPVLAELAKAQKTATAAIAGYRKLPTSPAGQKYYARVHAQWQSYLSGIAAVTTLSANGASEAEVNAAAAKPLALLAELPGEIAAWRTSAGTVADDNVASAHSTYSTAVWVIVALLVAATLIAGSLGFVLARSISARIRSLAGVADRIATGDLARELTDDAADEIGDTSLHFAAWSATSSASRRQRVRLRRAT